MDLNPQQDAKRELAQDLRIAEMHVNRDLDWNRKILDKLLFRKYRSNASQHRLTVACKDYGLENWSENLTFEKMKLVLIKRILYKDYEIVSNKFQKVSRKDGLKCELCQHQNICKVYKVLFKKDQNSDQKEILVGLECFKVLKKLIRTVERAQVTQNQNQNTNTNPI